MAVRNDTSTSLRDEIRIISPVAYFFAFLAYVAAAAAIVFVLVTNKGGDAFYQLPVLAPLGAFGATAIAGYVLLIGYINRDAGRRGMSRLAWTLIAIFIPHALGVVLYFVLRKPRTLSCPQCGTSVEAGFGFCPRCQFRLTPVCPHCQRAVSTRDKFCPYCGCDFRAGFNNVPAPAPNQT